jgi:peptidoglycan-associated lipoprotein
MERKTKRLICFALLACLVACESGNDGDVAIHGGGGMSVEDYALSGSAADFIANAGDRIFFGYDKSSITQEANATLRRQAEWLQTHPNLNVKIEGHCDERGTREYNIALGHRRAEAAARVLKDFGVTEPRISTISYGKDRPIAAQGTQEEIYHMNRVAISVLVDR